MAGRSKAQINAIVKSIEDEVLEEYGRRPHRQGKALGGWVCLDYDSVVVNVFSEDAREFYGIDKYWAAAQRLDLSEVVKPNAPEPSVDADEEEDDDWELGEDDDWALGLDDDDDDWSLDSGQSAAAGAGAAEAIDWDAHPENPANQKATPFDFAAPPAPPTASDDHEAERWEVELRFSEDDDDGAPVRLGSASDAGDDPLASEADPFASFVAEEVPAAVEEFEATIATEDDEEAIDRELLESGLLIEVDADGDDDDWAMGDEQLRAIVEEAERQAKQRVAATSAPAVGQDDDWALRGASSSDEQSDWRRMMEEDGWEDLEDTLEASAADLEDDDAEGAFFE